MVSSIRNTINSNNHVFLDSINNLPKVVLLEIALTPDNNNNNNNSLKMMEQFYLTNR